MPYLLEGSPSVVATSDAGGGWLHRFAMRGTDPYGINVTLNGIPVGDVESHTVYWVNLI
jgi:hypothetical protein